jgi:hypothetical protein
MERGCAIGLQKIQPIKPVLTYHPPDGNPMGPKEKKKNLFCGPVFFVRGVMHLTTEIPPPSPQ